jgi:hypothetical protein
METELFKMICTLVEAPIAKITLQNLKEKFSDSCIKKLVSAKILVPAPHNQDLDVAIDDEDRSYPIQSDSGGLFFFSPKSGRIPVKNDVLLVFQVNFDVIVRVIMSALGISSNFQPENILDDKIWLLGSAWLNRKSKTPMILGRRLIDQNAAEALQHYLKDRHTCNPALVLAISSHLPSYFQLHGQNRLVLMKDAIEAQNINLTLNIRYLAEKMGVPAEQYGFSEGFRVLKTHDGQVFKFSKMKASVLEVMHNAGKPMHQEEIMSKSDSAQNRLIDLFRNDPSWKEIFKTDGSGNYWLEY